MDIFTHIQTVLDELNKLPDGTITVALADGMQNVLSSAQQMDHELNWLRAQVK